MKIQIKDLTGNVLFEHEQENNTIKDTLIEAIRCNANLRNANLCGADLSYANLRNADLRYANLRNANLREANLHNVKNFPFIPIACPSDGAFIGWKKISANKENYIGNYLIKLEIPEDARRSSATGIKCRCDKAKVLEIININDGSHVDIITNIDWEKCVYKVGEMVYPDSFDENRWNECSNGIHFFINKQSAIDY